MDILRYLTRKRILSLLLIQLPDMNKLVLCWMITCLFFLGIFVFGQDKYAQVTILDVGQGSGAYIKTWNGFEVLVDVGETNKTLRTLGVLRPWWDRYIDLIIISHTDKDHAGMAPELLERFKVGHYIESPKPGTNGLYHAIHKKILDQGIRIVDVTPMSEIVLSDDATITFLHPAKGAIGNLTDNDASIVFILKIHEIKFLFMGDASVGVEKELMRRYPSLLNVDVLVVGHHGSKTSTSEEFVKEVRPRYAIISSGKENRYGHPHNVVIKRLEEYGVSVLRTDTHGTIQFRITTDSDFDIVTK